MWNKPWYQRIWRLGRTAEPSAEIYMRSGEPFSTALNPVLAVDSPGYLELDERVGVHAPCARGHRVIMLVAAILVLGAVDLALTLTTDSLGILHECNPAARIVMAQGVWAIVVYKVGLHVAGAIGLMSTRFKSSSELAALFSFALYAGLAIWWGVYLDHYSANPLLLATIPSQ